MKRSFLFVAAIALLGACSTQEKDFQAPIQDDVVFYASFEQSADEGTRVYANEDLLLRWTADDRVSIFNRTTYNQEYRFTGETGDNAGGFKKVDSDEFVTGNAISHVVSVYPYRETTKITESEVLAVTLPSEQSYAENTFGLGANTMVSVSSDDVLQFKNVGGYLVFKLYGEGVSVSSITLKGNNGEKLAGKATVTMPLDGVPSVSMADDAADAITLVCASPVTLGATAEESALFWFVLPPVTFSKGFTVTVSGKGGVFEKSTEKTVTIERNKLSKMSPIEVELKPTQPRNVIYYTSSDGAVVTPYKDYVFGAKILSNEYVDGLGVITFDGEVTSIGAYAFYSCISLTSITIPEGATSIGDNTFQECTNLTSITIQEGVTSIGAYAFYSCRSLSSITIPEGATSIGDSAFGFCTSLTSITIQGSVTSIGDYAFIGCTNLTNITIPDSVTSIGAQAFQRCTSLTSFTIPEGVTSIGAYAFGNCISLTSITVKPEVPPTGGDGMFFNTNNCPIYVRPGRIEAYRVAQYWSDYADRIQFIPSSTPVPEAVDLGLSVKWASFNLGAAEPEEYGDYYAWGEIEPKDDYSFETYKWCMGLWTAMTKYCNKSNYGYNGFTDTKTVLDLKDDAARANLGGTWRMPTNAEWTELRQNCTWTLTTQNGINGYQVTASNGNSIFLPAAGERGGKAKPDHVGTHGFYWSSSLYLTLPNYAIGMNYYSDNVSGYHEFRCAGFSIRPVCDE